MTLAKPRCDDARKREAVPNAYELEIDSPCLCQRNDGGHCAVDTTFVLNGG